MKKSIIIILLMCMVLPSIAQYKPVIFGFRLAPQLGWMKSDTEGYERDGVSPGFSWGLISEFYLMESYAVVTGFNMVFFNGKMDMPAAMVIDGDTVAGTLSRDFSLRHIEIPLTLKMQTELSENVKLFAKIGIGTAFKIKAKADDSFVSETGQKEEGEKDIMDDINLVRSSLIVGGGIQYHIKGSNAVIVEVIFNNGFTDLIKGSDGRATNNFVELGIGFVF